MDPAAVVERVRALGVASGDVLAVVVADDGLGLAGSGGAMSVPTTESAAVVGAVEAAVRPRWAMWSATTAQALVTAGVRVATSWDVAAVHRLLHGGWRADPAG